MSLGWLLETLVLTPFRSPVLKPDLEKRKKITPTQENNHSRNRRPLEVGAVEAIVEEVREIVVVIAEVVEDVAML